MRRLLHFGAATLSAAILLAVAVARVNGVPEAMPTLAFDLWALIVVTLALPAATVAIAGRLRGRSVPVGAIWLLVTCFFLGVYAYNRVKPFELWSRRAWAHGWGAFAAGPDRTEAARRLSSASRVERARAATSHRLLFIGIDGLDWDRVAARVDRGELPAIAGVLRAGRSFVLDAGPLSESPAIWSTIYTGQAAPIAGYEAWRFPGIARPLAWLPESGHRPIFGLDRWLDRTAFLRLWSAVPTSSRSLTKPALWRVSSAAGRLTAVITPLPQPTAGEAVNGVFVREVDAALVAHWQTASGRRDEVTPLPGHADLRAAVVMADDRRRLDTAVALLRRAPFALAIYYTRVVDDESHLAWDDTPAVEAAYDEADRTVAALREAFGPDAAIMLVSDHGWDPGPFEHVRVPHGMMVIDDGVADGFGGMVAVTTVFGRALAILGLTPNPSIAPVFLDDGEVDWQREKLRSLGYVGR